MYFRPSIFLSLILAISLNSKTSQVFGIIGDNTPRHKNTECALVIKHNGKFICSGALVIFEEDLQFVLTSAKCLWNGGHTANSHWPPEHIQILGWTPNFIQVDGIRRNAKKIVLHPGFDPRYLNHDIAVIFIDNTFEQVPEQFFGCNMPSRGSKISGGLVMMGFGTQNIELPTDGRLGKVVVPFVNHNICENFGHDPNEGHFCVGWLGKGGIGPCMGDEGGPALARQGLERQFYLAGIYSHTPAYNTRLRASCTDPRVPSVVTDVSKHMDWIIEELKSHNKPDRS